MQQYHDLVSQVLSEGVNKEDRTGTGTKSVFARQVRFNLNHGFPLVTSKFTSFRLIKEELLFFLRGERNIRSLVDRAVGIWTDWPLERYNRLNQAALSKREFEACISDSDEFSSQWGDLGPVYGVQWRSWRKSEKETVDQIAMVQDGLRKDPDGRRHIVTAWNPGDLDQMALPACHMTFQFYSQPYKVRTILGVEDRRALNCLVFQRSCDLFLGVPFNWASYALLTHMMAQCTGHTAGELTWVGGDVHLYNNSIKEAERVLGRPRHTLPRLWLNPEIKDIDDFTSEDIDVKGYRFEEKIRVPVAV